MHTDEYLIEKTKRLFESDTGWGDSNEWTNQDFVILSEKIQERTGVALSHVTLKRVWGKVKYDSLPNTHTLDTLVKFLGYENWREFKSQNGNGTASAKNMDEIVLNGGHTEIGEPSNKHRGLKRIVFIALPLVIVAVAIFLMRMSNKPKISDSDYSFSSKTVVSAGLPNSVIFNYDATKAPTDSVIIQQSWDTHLQVKVSKYDHQHTCIYYYPDYYKAKLIVGGKIVQMHRLLIRSNGWLPIVLQSPVPVYFTKDEVTREGNMALSAQKMQEHNIKMQPQPPTVMYSNVSDFGEIYSDDFVFETSVKDDYNEGAAACQQVRLYILCEGTAVGIPLCSKGCISDLDLLFTNFYTSGKKEDLSKFGVDFNSFVKVKVVSKNRKASIYLNDQLVYSVNKDIIKSKIVGFDFTFQGTGSVDYVKLSNGKVNYDEEF